MTLSQPAELFVQKEQLMGIAIALIVLALLIGGIGLVMEALWWMLIIAGALVIAGIVFGWLKRGSAGAGTPR